MRESMWINEKRGGWQQVLFFCLVLLCCFYLRFLTVYALFDCLSPAWLLMLMMWTYKHLPVFAKPWLFFLTGIILDILQQQTLGANALSFLLLYVVFSISLQTLPRRENMLMDAVLVFIFVFCLQLFLLLLLSAFSHVQFFWVAVIIQSFISALLWPWFNLLLRRLAKKYGGLA